MIRRLLMLVVAAMSALAVFAGAPGASAAGTQDGRPAVDRVLVLSMPTIAWEDVDLTRLPNLRALVAGSGVADMTMKGVRKIPSVGDSYVTMGAGARAVSRSPDEGQCLDASEPIEEGSAREALARRAGIANASVPPASIVCLAQPAIVARNDRLLFDAKVGSLAGALDANGVQRAVIANADEGEPPGVNGYQRMAGLALADAHGVVPAGAVGPELITRDPSAPFGVRANEHGYLAAFDRVWQGRAVVLVEASDLVRFDQYKPFVAADARPALQLRLLQQFDTLVGKMLAKVDPAHDAVLLLGPSQTTGPRRLEIAALRTPGLEPGLMKSAWTRKSGFVAIVDVAPTILDELGIARPPAMEGRPFERGRQGGGDVDARTHWLIDTNAASQFRDTMIPQVTTWFVILQVALTLGAIVAFLYFGKRALIAVELAALTLLGFLPATFLAGLLPFHTWPVAAYWAFLFGVGGIIALVAWLLTNRAGITTLIVVLSVMVGLIIIDVVTGQHLQFNTTMGYSPTNAGRFAGLGNLAYAQLAAGALLLAGLIAHYVGGRRGAWIGIALLVVAIVVDGAPMFGSDVGGVLSMPPAFAVAAVMLLGWQFRWRILAWGALGTLVLLVIFTALDMTRPLPQRTHLGRLVENGDKSGLGAVWTVILRKIDENTAVLFSSVWTIMLPLVLVALGYLIYRAPGRLRGIRERVPPLGPALAGVAIVAVLGFALNDSGIAIPGVMLGVLTPVLIVVTVRGERAVPVRHARRTELAA